MPYTWPVGQGWQPVCACSPTPAATEALDNSIELAESCIDRPGQEEIPCLNPKGRAGEDAVHRLLQSYDRQLGSDPRQAVA